MKFGFHDHNEAADRTHTKLDDGRTDSRIYRSNRNCDWIKVPIGFARTTAANRTQEVG